MRLGFREVNAKWRIATGVVLRQNTDPPSNRVYKLQVNECHLKRFSNEHLRYYNEDRYFGEAQRAARYFAAPAASSVVIEIPIPKRRL
jgi:hypothetical protein